MRRRFVLTLLGCVVVGAAACASPDAGRDPEAVEVFGPYRTTEADAFVSSLRRFSDRTGIDVRYTGSADFVDDLRTRALGGRSPDIAIVPQPALVDELIDEGVLSLLSDDVQAIVGSQYGSASEAAPDSHGSYGVPFRTTIKSLVWFRPATFDANGWEIPATLAELESLVTTIADSGEMAPWCFGIRSGAATGWPVSDWVEDLVLRLSGPDAYEQLASGRFDAIESELIEAFDQFDQLVSEQHVLGGRSDAPTIDVEPAVAPLFTDECALFKQADFALSWMPDGTEVVANTKAAGDVAAFVLPSVDGSAAPIVVGGDTAVQFDTAEGDGADRPDVDEVMAFLASADGAADWAAAGGFLSPRVDVDRASYFHPNSSELLDLVSDAADVRFDASDQLPIEFGFDVYLPALTRWVAGALDANTLTGSLAAASSPEG